MITEMPKSARLISIVSFILLLCPSDPLFMSVYLLGAGAFIFTVIKRHKLSDKPLNTTAILLSVCLNLVLAVIFINRWSSILGTYPTLLSALVLAIAGSLALPSFIRDFKIQPLSQKDIPDTRLTLSDILICAAASSVCLLISTHSSPLVPFNDYCDANCMFTIGRGILRGKIIYRDLIDQKGPLIFFIHALGAAISFSTYFGVWLCEVAACFASMLMGIKIHRLLSPDKGIISKISYIALTFSLYCSVSFFYGDSAEAYCLPFILSSVYLCIRSIKERDFPFKRALLMGAGMGVVFWIKYTICGSYVGMVLFILIFCLRNKKIKTLFRTALAMLMGLCLVSLPVLAYFLYKNAVSDMISVYFIDNIFNYNMAGSTESSSPIMPFIMLCSYLSENFPLFILILTGQIYMWKKDRNAGLMTLLSFMTCFTFAFIGSKSYPYYSFILTIFAITGWAPAIGIFKYILSSINKQNNKVVAAGISAILVIIFSIPKSPNLPSVGTDISESPVYGCSQVIRQHENPTLLCYGFLDRGFYTYNDIIPDIPYFTYLNANSEHLMQEQDRYIKEGNYEFIITEGMPHEFEGYELIYVDPNESEEVPYFLYQRIGD